MDDFKSEMMEALTVDDSAGDCSIYLDVEGISIDSIKEVVELLKEAPKAEYVIFVPQSAYDKFESIRELVDSGDIYTLEDGTKATIMASPVIDECVKVPNLKIDPPDKPKLDEKWFMRFR